MNRNAKIILLLQRKLSVQKELVTKVKSVRDARNYLYHIQNSGFLRVPDNVQSAHSGLENTSF
jgi:hypothetical protein